MSKRQPQTVIPQHLSNYMAACIHSACRAGTDDEGRIAPCYECRHKARMGKRPVQCVGMLGLMDCMQHTLYDTGRAA